jgi:hypothetical protein
LPAPSLHLRGKSFECGGGDCALAGYFRPLLEEIADLHGWHSENHVLALDSFWIPGARTALRFEPRGPFTSFGGAFLVRNNAAGLIGEPYCKIGKTGGHGVFRSWRCLYVNGAITVIAMQAQNYRYGKCAQKLAAVI